MQHQRAITPPWKSCLQSFWANQVHHTEISCGTPFQEMYITFKKETNSSSRNNKFFSSVFFWSQSTSTLWQIHYNTFHNKMQKQPRVPHIICHAAVKKKNMSAPGQDVHRKENCGPGKQVRGPKRRRGSGSAHRAGPKQSWAKTVQLAGPDTQSRNAFKQSKGGKRKTWGGSDEEREGGWKEGMRAEGICASLRESLLVLIYTSMTTAQNELTVSGGQQQPKSKKLEK